MATVKYKKQFIRLRLQTIHWVGVFLTKLKKLTYLENMQNNSLNHINVNTLRNKFDPLVNQIKNVDVLVVSERKLDNTFPESQSEIPGFGPPFQEDWNEFNWGFVIFIKVDIPAKSIFTHRTP